MIGIPGAIPHLLAGCVMFFIGWLYFRSYFAEHANREKLYLLLVCLVFSLIPDFFGGLYHVFHFLPFEVVEPFHILLHVIVTPLSLIVLLLLLFKIDIKRRPMWIMGFGCIVVHIIMDLLIHEHSMWI